jgi:HAD superfamily phosphoserine phosphatase-like hydrolase
MNIYDFDKTILDGDSTFNFYFFCLKKKPSLALDLFAMAVPSVKYFFGKITKTQYKERFYRFMTKIDCTSLLEEFWDKNIKLVKKFYLERQREDDIIISASPYFLLEPAIKRLGVKYLYATNVDPKTGKHSGINCHGEEKVRRFDSAGFRREDAEEFYSDSLSDTPLAKISKKAFVVTGEKLVPWEEYKLPLLKRIKRKLLERK